MSQTIPPQPIATRSLLATHRIIAGACAVLVLIGFGAAVVWEVLRVTSPPELVIIHPTDNLLTTETSIVLEGRAAKESAVTINDSPVAISTDGTFKETVDLRTGLNIITISASKKFAKPRIVYRRVVVSKE